MAAIFRRCSRTGVRGLNAFIAGSRPRCLTSLSPMLERNLTVEWKVDFSPKYFCTYTESVVEGSIQSATSEKSSEGSIDGESTQTGDGEDSELSGSSSTSSNDLLRISQRLGSVKNEETLTEAFEFIKNAEGTIEGTI